jgi:N-acetylneuraminic acid mutarotase
MKKNIVIFFCIIAGSFIIQSCSKSTPVVLPGSWTKLGDYPGVPRDGAVSFVINNVPYVGTGYNYASNQFLQDFWRYDVNNDSWHEVAAFPGEARTGAVAFALDGKGYVGTGYNLLNGGVHPLSDFWQFDPSVGAAGQWTQVSNLGFPAMSSAASARYGAIAFTVNNHAFVSCGTSSEELKDLWEYDQPSNQWVQRPDLVGSPRKNGFVVIINNGTDDIAYVGGGSAAGVTLSDFLKFDVTALLANAQPWTTLNEFKGNSASPSPRQSASTFSINGYGYLTCGRNGSGEVLGDLWQFSPAKDSWVSCSPITGVAPAAGAGRESSVGFAVGDFGFLTTGGRSSLKYDDCWQFMPTK